MMQLGIDLVCLFRALLKQVATSAPGNNVLLPAVGPDIAKLLVVVTLRKASLSSVYLYIDGNMVWAI
jgi:hypothetical protein